MLRPLQHLLETIYDAPSGEDVRDFLVTARAQLPPGRRAAGAAEELVLVQQRRASYLALYIDGALLERLAHNDPLRGLDESNIADFWTALEGVSHFSCLMWNARHARTVSQLELEMQAEIDKYIATYWLMSLQYPGHRPRELHHLLFERAQVNPSLPAATQQMYVAASQYAARFCTMLQSALLSNRPMLRSRAIAALRRFYRMGSAGKRRYIEAIA